MGSIKVFLLPVWDCKTRRFSGCLEATVRGCWAAFDLVASWLGNNGKWLPYTAFRYHKQISLCLWCKEAWNPLDHMLPSCLETKWKNFKLEVFNVTTTSLLWFPDLGALTIGVVSCPQTVIPITVCGQQPNPSFLKAPRFRHSKELWSVGKLHKPKSVMHKAGQKCMNSK